MTRSVTCSGDAQLRVAMSADSKPGSDCYPQCSWVGNLVLIILWSFLDRFPVNCKECDQSTWK